MKKIYTITTLRRAQDLGKIFFTSTLLIALFILPQLCLGIGMVTEPITFKDVLRGQELIEKLTFFNSEVQQATYELSSGGDIKDWVTFHKIDNTDKAITEIDAPGKEYSRAIAKINIPQDTPNGEYEGEVIIATKSVEEEIEGSGASLVLRVDRKIVIKITDSEIIKFSTAILPLKYSVKAGDPLQIKLIYTNKGNISVRPDVEMKIKKNNKTVFTAIYPYPEEEESAKPFEQKELSYIEWSTRGQENGKYIIEVKIKLGDEITEERDFSFNVGHDMSYYLGALAGIGSGRLGLMLIGIGVLLLGVFFVRTFIFKKKDWKNVTSFVGNLFS